MNELCENCRYWQAPSGAFDEQKGNCFRYPPTVLAHDGGYAPRYQDRPETWFDSFCGEYRENE